MTLLGLECGRWGAERRDAVRRDLEGRMTGTGVEPVVGRAVMQWLGEDGGECSFEYVRSKILSRSKNSVWEAHFPRSW